MDVYIIAYNHAGAYAHTYIYTCVSVHVCTLMFTILCATPLTQNLIWNEELKPN